MAAPTPIKSSFMSPPLLWWIRPWNPSAKIISLPLRTVNMGLPVGTRNSSGDNKIDMGVRVGNYNLKWRLLPPLVLLKYPLNIRADRINMARDYQKHILKPRYRHIGLIIVLRRQRTRI